MSGDAAKDGSAAEGRGEGWEPMIVAFTCNWCSYAGADFAGISRTQYPANVRLIRLMCSGRVHPAFVLGALELGADGVLVTGCHPGDCHYTFGNISAEIQIEAAKGVAEMAGLRSDRIHLQWISASEGALFGETVREFTEHVHGLGPNPLRGASIEQTVLDMALTKAVDVTAPPPPEEIPATTDAGLAFLRRAFDATAAYMCVECGKCTGICPVTARLPTFHPRRMVIKGLYGLDGELAYDPTIWACLTCGLCKEACRMDVDLPEFFRRLRVLARTEGQAEVGTHGGLVHTFERICSHTALRPYLTSWALPHGLTFDSSSDTVFVSGFSGALSHIVPDVEYDAAEVPRGGVRILNTLGVRPHLFGDERPSGHDLYYSGEDEAFERLARLNAEALRETGAERAVFVCPETMHTYRDLYPAVLGEPLGVECVHVIELVAKAIREEQATVRMLPGDASAGAMAFHDSCRMGRMLGLYDEPRHVIAESGDDRVELEHNRGYADCCGVGAWQRCDSTSRKLRTTRLQEAVDAGAGRLVSPCPRCSLHFRCQQCHDGTEGSPDTMDVMIVDLVTYIADRLVKL